MALEVFKCTTSLNPPCLNGSFKVKEPGYHMRNPTKLVQPKRRSTRHGIRSFSYLGAKLWNDLMANETDFFDMTVGDFKCFLDSWKGPDFCTFNHYM